MMEQISRPRTISLHNRSDDENAVPLYLLSWTVARQVRKTGARIYRISVKRTHWHLYNVIVRTKAHQREPSPVVIDVPCAIDGPYFESPVTQGCSA